MLVPLMFARIVESRGFFGQWIKRGDIGSFILVAAPASRTEIVECVFATMFLRNDMVNMKLSCSMVRANKTVFAAATGTAHNLAMLS